MAENTSAAARPPYFGTVLRRGASGPDVALVQTWLDGLRGSRPALPALTVDGRFGENTREAVKRFQAEAGLAADGAVGPAAWQALYAAWAGEHGEGEAWPGVVVRRGEKGAVVKSMQQKLRTLAKVYTAIETVAADGVYGRASAAALAQFQRQFALPADGVFGKNTFAALARVAAQTAAGAPPAVLPRYPGLLRQGSTGDGVRCVQSYLAALGEGVPRVAVDGRYGASTAAAVRSFQRLARLAEDGKVGPVTWSALVMAFNRTLG